MNPFVGLFIATLGLVGLSVVLRLRYKANKETRLRKALQEWVDMLVDLYDSDDNEPTA